MNFFAQLQNLSMGSFAYCVRACYMCVLSRAAKYSPLCPLSQLVPFSFFCASIIHIHTHTHTNTAHPYIHTHIAYMCIYTYIAHTCTSKFILTQCINTRSAHHIYTYIYDRVIPPKDNSSPTPTFPCWPRLLALLSRLLSVHFLLNILSFSSLSGSWNCNCYFLRNMQFTISHFTLFFYTSRSPCLL